MRQNLRKFRSYQAAMSLMSTQVAVKETAEQLQQAITTIQRPLLGRRTDLAKGFPLRCVAEVREKPCDQGNLPRTGKNLYPLLKVEPLCHDVPLDDCKMKCCCTTEEISAASIRNRRLRIQCSDRRGCHPLPQGAVKADEQPYTTLYVGHDKIPMKFKFNPTQIKLAGYGGHEIPTTCKIECKLRGNKNTIEFFITDTEANPITGFNSGKAIGLIHIEDRMLKVTQVELAKVRMESPLPRSSRSYSMDLVNSRGLTRCRRNSKCAP